MIYRLPPLNALRVFEAAARHLSFKDAANELHITQAAVSHQVKSLEDYLGVELFRRAGRGVQLTEAARACLPKLREGFDALAAAVEMVRERGGDAELAITAPPEFTARWRMRRRSACSRREPRSELRVFGCGGVLVVSPPEQYWRSTPNEALCKHDAWPPARRVCYYRLFETHWKVRAEIHWLEQELSPPAGMMGPVMLTARRGGPARPPIQFTWGTASTPWRGTNASLISVWYVAIPALPLCAVFLRGLRQEWFRRSRWRANCCPTCAYPLFGLPERRCPECGTVVRELPGTARVAAVVA